MASSWYKDFMAEVGVEAGGFKPSKSKPGPLMDLANMRDNGVRSIEVYCLDCAHRADVNVDQFPAHWPVKSFEGRMVCGGCGGRRVDVRPAWHTKHAYIPPP